MEGFLKILNDTMHTFNYYRERSILFYGIIPSKSLNDEEFHESIFLSLQKP